MFVSLADRTRESEAAESHGQGRRDAEEGREDTDATRPIRRLQKFDTAERICETQDCCPLGETRLSSLTVPKWRNWQTRVVQVHVLARVWGFESLLRHQDFRIFLKTSANALI